MFWWETSRSWSISAKALPGWYKHLIYTQWNMCKHLEVIIEVSLILFYSVTYLHLGVSEQDLGCFRGKQSRSWCIGTKALPEWYKHLIYNQWNMCKHLEVIIEMSLILFYGLMFIRFGESELDIRRYMVVNGLICGVSVPRHFLNDTNILYITNAMYTNIWKSSFVGYRYRRNFLNDTNILYITHATCANI